LLGNTLIEREQRYGYFETALLASSKVKNLTFRNIGWSGDNVFGRSRAGFGAPGGGIQRWQPPVPRPSEFGFKELQKHVLATKPTLLLVGYGGNESFAGEQGLETFTAGLNTLLDFLDGTGARIVLLSPIGLEKLDPPFPDPTEHNRQLKLYTDAIAAVAHRRGYPMVNLLRWMSQAESQKNSAPLTYNSMHLNESGYRRLGPYLATKFADPPQPWRVLVDISRKVHRERGTHLENLSVQSDPSVKPNKVEFQLLDEQLPIPVASATTLSQLAGERKLFIKGLPEGEYRLSVDGSRVVSASAAHWAQGVILNTGPEFDQVEKLRQTIIEKDRLYFYRYRPQNNTYLFLFRKHEQGQNAKEIPMFDPLIETKEKQIEQLRTPRPRQYKLERLTKT